MADFLAVFQAGDATLEVANRTYVILLPKKDVALATGNFRPVSLQNCAPKIVSNILTSTLQPFIVDPVSLLQIGFIRGRNITDNFLFATELVQCRHKWHTPTIVPKLDFRKAFDSVSWRSLDTVLATRGWDGWRGMVNSLLSTGKTMVLLNGVPGPWI